MVIALDQNAESRQKVSELLNVFGRLQWIFLAESGLADDRLPKCQQYLEFVNSCYTEKLENANEVRKVVFAYLGKEHSNEEKPHVYELLRTAQKDGLLAELLNHLKDAASLLALDLTSRECGEQNCQAILDAVYNFCYQQEQHSVVGINRFVGH
jgi:hypothetical protein